MRQEGLRMQLPRCGVGHPGRIVDTEQITVRTAPDAASVRVCYYFKKGEPPAQFANTMKRIFEKHWG